MRTLKVILCLLIFTIVKVDMDAQEVIKPPKYPDGVYTKENTRTKKAISYTHLREADVMWSKRIWRIIDLREKINLPLYYPTSPILDRKSLFDVVKTAAITSGTITCFNGSDDEFRMDLTPTEVEKMLSAWDSTNQAEDVNNPGVMISAPIKKDITSDEITKYELKEDWFFDKQRSVLDVRIVGLLVIKAKKAEGTGEFVGDSPLFWIYFPEARPILANQEVYMRHNDAERRTFDEIFWKRLFSSYVVKETNVYDRVISEYTSSINALLEAERVKNDIFTFEHDLWHF